MKDVLTEQQNNTILNALDEALANGPWDQSNFLCAIKKNLQEVRDNFATEISKHQSSQIRKNPFALEEHNKAQRREQQEVYVSLYSADGTNLQSWERILSNLPKQIISRPIYASEEHVQNLIKTKENKLNEAYVAIYINDASILSLSPDKALTDKLGSPLLTLKDKALNLENISRFVHNMDRYHYDNGRLVKE